MGEQKDAHTSAQAQLAKSAEAVRRTQALLNQEKQRFSPAILPTDPKKLADAGLRQGDEVILERMLHQTDTTPPRVDADAA